MTYNPDAIAVFVKTPTLSPVKTRLAETIGEEKAIEFYKLSLSAVNSVIEPLSMEKYWAIGEENGINTPLWQERARLWTGEGDLGQRQDHVYKTLGEGHAHIMFLGADCPQISRDFIEDAFEQLKSHDYIIGPAEDGGYYLFLGKKPINSDAWTNVTYSQDTTMKQLYDNLSGSIHRLNTLSDVDYAHDLPKMLYQMPYNTTEAQKTLISWTNKLLEE